MEKIDYEFEVHAPIAGIRNTFWHCLWVNSDLDPDQHEVLRLALEELSDNKHAFRAYSKGDILRHDDACRAENTLWFFWATSDLTDKFPGVLDEVFTQTATM